MNRKGRDREGYVVGGIQKPRPTGFTEDTKTSNPLDNFRDERVTHYHLDPYQVRYVDSLKQRLSIKYRLSRSLRARDPLFDDGTHDHKGRLQKQSEIF